MNDYDENRDVLLSRLMDSDQYERAEELLRELLQQEPESVYYHSSLGSCYFHLDREKESRKEFEIVIKLDPEYDFAYYMLATIDFLRVSECTTA